MNQQRWGNQPQPSFPPCNFPRPPYAAGSFQQPPGSLPPPPHGANPPLGPPAAFNSVANPQNSAADAPYGRPPPGQFPPGVPTPTPTLGGACTGPPPPYAHNFGPMPTAPAAPAAVTPSRWPDVAPAGECNAWPPPPAAAGPSSCLPPGVSSPNGWPRPGAEAPNSWPPTGVNGPGTCPRPPGTDAPNGWPRPLPKPGGPDVNFPPPPLSSPNSANPAAVDASTQGGAGLRPAMGHPPPGHPMNHPPPRPLARPPAWGPPRTAWMRPPRCGFADGRPQTAGGFRNNWRPPFPRPAAPPGGRFQRPPTSNWKPGVDGKRASDAPYAGSAKVRLAYSSR